MSDFWDRFSSGMIRQFHKDAKIIFGLGDVAGGVAQVMSLNPVLAARGADNIAQGFDQMLSHPDIGLTDGKREKVTDALLADAIHVAADGDISKEDAKGISEGFFGVFDIAAPGGNVQDYNKAQQTLTRFDDLLKGKGSRDELAKVLDGDKALSETFKKNGLPSNSKELDELLATGSKTKASAHVQDVKEALVGEAGKRVAEKGLKDTEQKDENSDDKSTPHGSKDSGPSADDHNGEGAESGGSSKNADKDLSQDDSGSGGGKSADKKGNAAGDSGVGVSNVGIRVTGAGSGGSGGSGGGGSTGSSSDSSKTESKHKLDEADSSENEGDAGEIGSDGQSGDSSSVNTSDSPLNQENTETELPASECTTAGEPINLFTGEELLQLDDFSVPGPIPINWQRTYRSSNAKKGALGFGWTHVYSDCLMVEDQQLVHLDQENRRISYDIPLRAEPSWQPFEKAHLHFVDDDTYKLVKKGAPEYWFKRVGIDLFSLAAIGDEGSNQLLFKYDGEQKLQSILCRFRGCAEKQVVFAHNTLGLIETISLISNGDTENAQTLARYHYDEQIDLVRAEDPAENAELYAYHNHVITRRTLKTGFSFYFEWDQYDANGKCLKNWGDNGNYSYQFHWNKENGRNGVTNSNGITEWYEFNKRGQVTKYIDGEGGVHLTRYDKMGNVVETVNPLGHRSSFEYNEQGLLVSATNVLGHTIEITHDESSNPVLLKDAQGYEWRWVYDQKQRITAAYDPLGNATQYSFGDEFLEKITLPDGSSTVFSWDDLGHLRREKTQAGDYSLESNYKYDQAGRVIQNTRSDGVTVNYHYDAQDRIQSVVKNDEVTEYEYDRMGRLCSIIDPNGSKESLTYNENGLLTSFTDKLGRITHWHYEGLSQVICRINPDGSKFYYEYDGERNLTALINENGDRYELDYDGNERLIKEIGFDGRVQEYQYDSAGDLICKRDGLSRSIEYIRDELGQLLSLQANDGTFKNFRYDANGKITYAQNNHSELELTYDPLGNLLMESQGDSRISHLYDEMSRCLQTMTPDGHGIANEYDGLGLPTAISYNGKLVTAISRDSLGREVERQQGAIRTQTEYDPNGRLKQRSHFLKEKIHDRQKYQYDSVGRIQSIERLKLGKTEYQYDPLDRLTSVKGIHEETFQFDPAGNILGSPLHHDSSKAHRGNRLAFYGDRKFSYDDVGNLVQESRGKGGKLTTQFTYNALNELVGVNKEGQNFEFKYDAFGRRISKTDSFGETSFRWKGDVLLQEKRKHIEKVFIFEPDSFIPAAMVQDSEVFHYKNDHLGTPYELNNEDGESVWRVTYSAYGKVVGQEFDRVENPIRFQGQYYDDGVQLHYNRHRFYDPGVGRFIHQDPIGLRGGNNCYEYGANPIHWIDPLGLKCKEGGLLDWLIGEDSGAAWLDPLGAIDEATEKTDTALGSLVASGLDPQINDNKYGHATQLSYLQNQFGLLGAPFVFLGGLAYEAYHLFVPGHVQGGDSDYDRSGAYFGLFDGQNPINWLYDTPGDILGNTFGQLTAILNLDFLEVNKWTLMIPGPNYSADRDNALGRPDDFFEQLAPPGMRYPG